MDKLQLTGRNLGQVFNSRSGCLYAIHLCCYKAKRPNLKLKTLPIQLNGFLSLAFMLHDLELHILHECAARVRTILGPNPFKVISYTSPSLLFYISSPFLPTSFLTMTYYAFVPFLCKPTAFLAIRYTWVGCKFWHFKRF
jgi:hypothetical protein